MNIKEFRAWDDSKKEMVYNFEILANDMKCYRTKSDFLNGNYITDNHEHIMQYTGFNDINGKKVYQGDIAIFYYMPDKYSKVLIIFDVKFNNAFCGVLLKNLEFDERNRRMFFHEMLEFMNHIEIIGNVHENPGLLDNKK